MHLKRLVIALIVLPVLYFYLMKLPAAYFFMLLLIVSAAAQSEFYSMYRIRGVLKTLGLLSGIALLSAFFISGNLVSVVLASSFIIISSVRLIGKKDPTASLNDTAPVMLALLYIPLLLGFQYLIREKGPEWILFLYGCVWASDSLAYYIGKTIGKKKLYSEISPNKTVAGAFGSLLGGALAGWLLSTAFIPLISFREAIAIGTVIGGTTIIGDLVESMFKRDAGVKDSGSIIPGHGGILDKIDGVLFAGPVFYWTSKVFDLLA